MASQTEKLGLYTWLENDPVDFEQLNNNFEKLESCSMVVESGTKTSGYSGGPSGYNATWYYKKYSDKTIEMSTKLEFTNLKCNYGESAPYHSGDSTVYFPFNFSKIYDVQMSLASNTLGWVVNVTGQSIIDKIMFKVMNVVKEETESYKQVYITVKGVEV